MDQKVVLGIPRVLYKRFSININQGVHWDTVPIVPQYHHAD